MLYPECRILTVTFLSLAIAACGGAEQVKVTAAETSSEANTAIAAEAEAGVEVETAIVTEMETETETETASVLTQPVNTSNLANLNAVTDVGVPGDQSQDQPASGSAVPKAKADWWQPKASENLKWQWQLQGRVDTTLPVQVYNIDIEVPQKKIDELRARGIKLICYFSAGTVEDFRDDADQFAEKIIGEQYEDLIDERWVDYADIDSLAPVMRARLDKCKSKGFDAVEIDNVDAHNYESRDEQGNVINIGTNFQMTLDESTAYVLWLADEAHSRGLGIGLKNAEEMVPDVVDKVDWMLVEDCYFDSWCMAATAFIDADKPVFMAEYDDLVPDFAPACELAKSLGFTAIWRDPGLSTRLYLACE